MEYEKYDEEPKSVSPDTVTVVDETTSNIGPTTLSDSDDELDEEEKLLQRCILRNFMERSH